MSLVPKDQMTILRSASEAKATAQSAEDEIQLQAVAYAINNASNTGQYEVVFQEKLRDATKSELEAKGYTIKYIRNNAYDVEHQALIIWRATKAGDEVAEPSNSGPKYSNHKDDED